MLTKIVERLRKIWSFSSLGRSGGTKSVDDFCRFLDSRPAFVSQTTLYGYLKTRSGRGHAEIFTNETYVVSINMAKWRVYLASLSDLAMYAGGLIANRTDSDRQEVSALIEHCLRRILDEHGTPAGSDENYAVAAEAVFARIKGIAWTEVGDDESPFSESPEALYEWAPIADELKTQDEEIVRNSIRFKWRDVRVELRRGLDADAVLADFRQLRLPESINAVRPR
jgi:hypothetical protein